MPDDLFDQDAWLGRIGYTGSRAPTLATLHGLVDAHSAAISYESIDVLLDRSPRLDLASLQRKMIAHRRGGYCFEQNMLFRGGLRSLGFDITSLQARVVRGLAIDAPRPMLHMVLQVNLPEGPYLADVGFGNLAPTAPLQLAADIEQDTPHEIMRFIRMGDELTLQSRLGDRWEPYLPRRTTAARRCRVRDLQLVYRQSSRQSVSQQPDRGAPRTESDPCHAVQCKAQHTPRHR